MQHRRLSAAAALLATSGLLAACGQNSSSGDENTLTVTAASGETIVLEAITAAFEEANPGVTVEVTTSGVDQYQTTTRTQLSSGSAPDVLFVWPGDGNPMAMQVAAEAGFLHDLSDRPWVEDIPDGIRPVTEIDGQTWIAPVTFSGIGAVYNMDAVADAGLEPPETRTELLEFCADAQDAGVPAFSLGAQTPWVTQLVNYAIAPTLVYGPDPEFPAEMAAGDATFADSPWRDTMEQYMEMADSGCFQDQPLGTSYEASLEAVASGDALGVIQVNDSLTALGEQSPDTEFTMLPVPATDDPEDTRMAGAAGSSYAINADAPNIELATEFIDFLASPEGMNTYAETNNGLPAIPNDDFTADPALASLAEYQADGRTDPFMDQLWPNARVQQTHFAVVQELLSGSVDVDAALTRMDEAYAEGE
ncbi:ABC transporter substrate-binding protein [Nocardiopsis sediminis]|uniref:ABC transporter substrate-binding protein n=1 Tax=Nocardiopsis sediminis TaxID=1778267 RepID=A0ABV8FU44_9ACTN